MTLSDHQFEFMKDLNILLDFIIRVKKIKVTGGDLNRIQEVQNMYFDQGLSKTKLSNHLFRCAIDLNVFVNKEVLTNIAKSKLDKSQKDTLDEIGVFWENLNKLNRWGGFFKSIYDPGHFERNVK